MRGTDAVRPAAGALHRYADGDAIARQGDGDAGAWLVVSGSVRLEVVAEDGREGIVAVVAPGEAFGLSQGSVAPWTAIAAGSVEVVRVAATEVDALARTRPGDAASLIRGLLAHQSATDGWLADLTVLPLADRLASRLTDLARRIGEPTDGGRALPRWLTQERIGRAVGATRESVNRTLRTLARRGTVRVAGRRLVVPPPADDAATREIGSVDPATTRGSLR